MLELDFIFKFKWTQALKTTWAIHILSPLQCLICLPVWHPDSLRQLTLNSLSPPRLLAECRSVSLYSEFCRGGGWERAESDKILSRTGPYPIPRKWHLIKYFTIPIPNFNLFWCLALLLSIFEIGKPDPVEDEDRHAEDEEHSEGVSPPLDRAVAEQHLGGQQAQSKQDVNIPRMT